MCFKKLATLTLVASMLMSQSVFATAKTTTGTAIVSVNKTKKQTGVTTGGVNLRSQANTKSKVLVTLKKNTKLTILKKENGWLKVQYGKKVGYVSAKYVKVTSNSSSKPVENKKPVTNSNSNSANKKPTSNITKGMDLRQFDKWAKANGADDCGGVREKKRPVGIIGAWEDYQDDDVLKAYITSRYVLGTKRIYVQDPEYVNFRAMFRNSLNLLLPTKGEDIWNMISKGKITNQTLYGDGRVIEIENEGTEIFITIYDKK